MTADRAAVPGSSGSSGSPGSAESAARPASVPSGAPAGFELEAWMSVERTRVEAALSRSLEGLRGRLSPELGRVLGDGVGGRGKRIRPLLCVAGYRATRRDEKLAPPVYDLAVSLELIHAYSLMHDDLPCMDDAPLRRGRPTPHTVHGVAPTTWGATLLIVAAVSQAHGAARRLGLPARGASEVARTLAVASGRSGMVGGQALDLLAEGRPTDEARLEGLQRMKTGALLTASLVMGGLGAGAAPGQLRGLERFGRSIGLAFQMADDVLDRTSTAERLGKAPSDEQLDKSTWVTHLGVDGARRRAVELVDEGRAALREGGVESSALTALAGYIVDRSR